MPADPNWLFSSTAQSAAAVFAIVAGFITTRILGLAAERRAITHQIAERQGRFEELKEHRAQLTQEKVDMVVDRFREQVKDKTMFDNEPPPQEVISGTADRDVPEHVLKAEFDNIVGQWAKVRSFISSKEQTIEYGEDDARRWLIKQGADPAEFDIVFVEHLYEEKRKEVAPVGTTLSSFSISPGATSFVQPSASDPVVEINTRLTEADLEVQILERELETLRQRLPSLVMPRSGWWAIGILAFIGASSVVLPLSFLPATNEERWMRPTIVGLFAAGLAALLVYIVWEFASMLQPPDDPESRPPPAR